MPFNGSGTYTLPAGNPVTTGTTISSTTTNSTNSDIATALTNCVTRDGQSPATANLPLGGFKVTGLAAGTSNGDSVRYEQVQYLANVGSAGSSGSVLTSAGTGAPTWTAQADLSVGNATNATTSTNLANGAAGKIPFQTGSGSTSFTAVGTSGQVLTSAGTGTPTWTSPSGMSLVATLTPANGVTTIASTSIPSYKNLIFITDYLVLSNQGNVGFSLSSDNGSTYGDLLSFTSYTGFTVNGYISLYRADVSSSNKPYIQITETTCQQNTYRSTTGIINAVKFTIYGGVTFTGSGKIYIYGSN